MKNIYKTLKGVLTLILLTISILEMLAFPVFNQGIFISQSFAQGPGPGCPGPGCGDPNQQSQGPSGDGAGGRNIAICNALPEPSKGECQRRQTSPSFNCSRFTQATTESADNLAINRLNCNSQVCEGISNLEDRHACMIEAAAEEVENGPSFNHYSYDEFEKHEKKIKKLNIVLVALALSMFVASVLSTFLTGCLAPSGILTAIASIVQLITNAALQIKFDKEMEKTVRNALIEMEQNGVDKQLLALDKFIEMKEKLKSQLKESLIAQISFTAAFGVAALIAIGEAFDLIPPCRPNNPKEYEAVGDEDVSKAQSKESEMDDKLMRSRSSSFSSASPSGSFSSSSQSGGSAASQSGGSASSQGGSASSAGSSGGGGYGGGLSSAEMMIFIPMCLSGLFGLIKGKDKRSAENSTDFLPKILPFLSDLLTPNLVVAEDGDDSGVQKSKSPDGHDWQYAKIGLGSGALLLLGLFLFYSYWKYRKTQAMTMVTQTHKRSTRVATAALRLFLAMGMTMTSGIQAKMMSNNIKLINKVILDLRLRRCQLNVFKTQVSATPTAQQGSGVLDPCYQEQGIPNPRPLELRRVQIPSSLKSEIVVTKNDLLKFVVDFFFKDATARSVSSSSNIIPNLCTNNRGTLDPDCLCLKTNSCLTIKASMLQNLPPELLKNQSLRSVIQHLNGVMTGKINVLDIDPIQGLKNAIQVRSTYEKMAEETNKKLAKQGKKPYPTFEQMLTKQKNFIGKVVESLESQPEVLKEYSKSHSMGDGFIKEFEKNIPDNIKDVIPLSATNDLFDQDENLSNTLEKSDQSQDGQVAAKVEKLSYSDQDIEVNSVNGSSSKSLWEIISNRYLKQKTLFE